MTMSPAHENDHWGTISPTGTQLFDSGVLGICSKQTANSNTHIVAYCKKHDIQYKLKRHETIEILQQDCAGNGIVIHDRCFIVHLKCINDQLNVMTIVVYKTALISLTVTPPINFFVEPLKHFHTTIDCFTMPCLLQSKKAVLSHSPFVADILPVFEDMDVCMTFWYSTIDKNKYAVFYQNARTYHLYCATKGCKKKFKTIEEWALHFDVPFNIPCTFFNGIICQGTIVENKGAKLYKAASQSQASCETIKKKLGRHSYAFKTLGDQVHGPQFKKHVVHKLCKLLQEKCKN